MPLKRIRFTPKVTGPDADKVVGFRVRLEVDGAPQGDEKYVRKGDKADFGEIELAVGRHELTARVYNMKADGLSSDKAHIQKYPYEAKDTVPPPEAEDGEFEVEDVGAQPQAEANTPVDAGGAPPVDVDATEVLPGGGRV